METIKIIEKSLLSHSTLKVFSNILQFGIDDVCLYCSKDFNLFDSFH